MVSKFFRPDRIGNIAHLVFLYLVFKINNTPCANNRRQKQGIVRSDHHHGYCARQEIAHSGEERGPLAKSLLIRNAKMHTIPNISSQRRTRRVWRYPEVHSDSVKF